MSSKKIDKREWVSASKAGRAEFCPHYLELERQRTQVSKRAKVARIKGDAKHERLNQRAQDKRCFIASHLYGVDDKRTELLREFRDTQLNQSHLGKLFIVVYYRLSPSLVVLAKHSEPIDNLLESVVDKIVNKLSQRDRNG